MGIFYIFAILHPKKQKLVIYISKYYYIIYNIIIFKFISKIEAPSIKRLFVTCNL